MWGLCDPKGKAGYFVALQEENDSIKAVFCEFEASQLHVDSIRPFGVTSRRRLYLDCGVNGWSDEITVGIDNTEAYSLFTSLYSRKTQSSDCVHEEMGCGDLRRVDRVETYARGVEFPWSVSVVTEECEIDFQLSSSLPPVTMVSGFLSCCRRRVWFSFGGIGLSTLNAIVGMFPTRCDSRCFYICNASSTRCQGGLCCLIPPQALASRAQRWAVIRAGQPDMTALFAVQGSNPNRSKFSWHQHLSMHNVYLNSRPKPLTLSTHYAKLYLISRLIWWSEEIFSEREQRGLQLAALSRIEQNPLGWKVPSQSGNGSYVVRVDGEPFCTCPDFEARQLPCKHIYAVEYVIQREMKADGTESYTESVKVTYTQEWTAYNQAQTNEHDHFVQLLRSLCDGIPQPPQGNGRPRLPLSDVVFGLAYKTYGTLSGRRSASALRNAHTDGLVDKAGHYNSLFRYLENPALTPHFPDQPRGCVVIR